MKLNKELIQTTYDNCVPVPRHGLIGYKLMIEWNPILKAWTLSDVGNSDASEAIRKVEENFDACGMLGASIFPEQFRMLNDALRPLLLLYGRAMPQ